MSLEQAACELHHLLVLVQLQSALTEVERERHAHLLQGLPVFTLILNPLGVRGVRGRGTSMANRGSEREEYWGKGEEMPR